MQLQSPSAPSVLPLALPLGFLGSVQWLDMSMCICIDQVLIDILREQPYQATVSKSFLALAIVSADGMGPYVAWSLDSLSFHLCSIFCLSFLWNISGLTILKWVGGPIPTLGALPIYCRWFLQVLSLICS